MKKAFVLGAGMGERLRPLTAQLPKPLIPFFHRPLICEAFDHLQGVGVESLVVNTHHLAGAYGEAFPEGVYGGAGIVFRQELPERLETAGGMANVADLLDGEESFWVYNGDVLTDLSLQKLAAAHAASDDLVTLAVRRGGPALHLAVDAGRGKVLDIRNQLGSGAFCGHLFTGVYLVRPEFLRWLTPGKKESVIPIFLRLIEQGLRLGAVEVDEGMWWDLGSRASYLDAHLAVAEAGRAGEAIHEEAVVAAGARLRGLNVLGPGAVVEAGAELEDCILWPGARAAAGCRLRRCIVRSGEVAVGEAEERDF